MFLLVILSLPTIIYFTLQQNKIQQYLVQKLSSKLSTVFGTSVTIKKANIDLFANFHLTDFCILDRRNDTMIYVPDFIIKPSAFAIASKQVGISNIVLKNPKINFYIDSTRTINLQIIVDKLASKDTTNKQGWTLLFKNIKIIHGDFRLQNYYKNEVANGFNFTDIHLFPLDVQVKRMSNAVKGIELKIKNLSAIDQSGFRINKMSCRLKINPENMAFNNLKLMTPESNIDADQVRLNFPEFRILGNKDVFDKLRVYTEFNPSDISSNDLAYFVPFFQNFPIDIKFSGSIKGLLNDLKGRDIKVSYGQDTKIDGSFDIIGLPNIKSSFLHVNINNLATSPDDIQTIYIPNSQTGHLVFPSNFKQIKFFNYKGKFTGFLSDFVAYGTLRTNLGTIESDLSFKPDSTNRFAYQGKLKMHQFQIGKYVSKEDLLGDISLNVMVQGKMWDSKKFSAKLEGIISSLVYNNYNYKNLKIDGSVSNSTFNGSASIIDPNISMNFIGNVNLTKEIPSFNFTANVKHIDLFQLNFDKKDSVSKASFLVTANFEGNNIDNLKGEVNLWNSKLTKTGKEIEINDLLMFTQTIKDTNRIIIRSDFADAEIWGTYKLRDLQTSFKSLAKQYIPALINDTTNYAPSENNFSFEINFKNTKSITDFLLPGLYVSTDSKLTGSYYPAIQKFDFLFSAPILQHQNKKWYNVYFNGKAYKDSFSIVSGCNNLKLNNQLRLDNFTILSTLKKDSIDLAFRWNNWDTISYKGNISLKGVISRPNTNDQLTLNFKFNPSKLILKDTVWAINTGMIIIDPIGYSVDKLVLSHKNQSLMASGRISKNESDIFSIDFANVDLGNIKTIANSSKINVDGIINGTAKFSDLLNNPEIFTSVTIDSLKFNKQMLGNTSITARWNSLNKDISLNLISKDSYHTGLTINGVYQIEPKLFDFKFNLDNLNVQLFEPYLANIFSDIRGSVSGSLSLTGTLNNPLINGNINTPKTTLIVNYLKTKYKIAETLPIVNNVILFKNTEVYDKESNMALINGTINYRKLKDLDINLTITANKFESLNTTAKDNSLFYGKAFTTGSVKINGIAPNLTMDINATTNKNTAIFIPLTSKSELAESNYIRFVEKQQPEDPFSKYELVKKEDKKEFASNYANLKMNFNLKVTTDAEMQIVFDQKIGDLIQGTGNGNINMTFDDGNFKMFGEYTIERGEYLFTLQNIINKKFEVEKGGTITWSGDPLDATVNIAAIYNKDRVKASLYDLNHKYTDYKHKLPVYCRIFMTEKLLNPTIRYDIYLPTADQSTRNIIANEINTDEELNKQFISLIFINNFVPKTDEAGSQAIQSNQGMAAVGVTGIEFLSNQFSNWLSQISKDFDIGINYHPGDELTNQEVEVALSTQILSDRVTINTNLDIGGNKITNQAASQNNTKNIVGDVDVNVKITQNGKLQFKFFNRSNDLNLYENNSIYTQGIGIFYKEDFNSFRELAKRYYKALFTKKEEKPEPVDENEEDKSAVQQDSTFVTFIKKNDKK